MIEITTIDDQEISLNIDHIISLKSKIDESGNSITFLRHTDGFIETKLSVYTIKNLIEKARIKRNETLLLQFKILYESLAHH